MWCLWYQTFTILNKIDFYFSKLKIKLKVLIICFENFQINLRIDKFFLGLYYWIKSPIEIKSKIWFNVEECNHYRKNGIA